MKVKGACGRTGLGRELFKIYVQTDIVVWFWLGAKHGAVFALENIQNTILQELVPAADAHREQEGGLAVRGGQMESDTIEIDELDIETGWPARAHKHQLCPRTRRGGTASALCEFICEGGLDDVVVRLQTDRTQCQNTSIRG